MSTSTAILPPPATRSGTAGWQLAIWAVAALLVLLWRLGAPPLFDVDEGAFSEATREMLASGDYGHTTLNGADRFDKPIGVYWLQAASVGLLGLNEFALRLPSALAAWGWALALVAFAWPRWGRAAALGGGTMLLGSLGVLAIGRAATADALLNLLLALAAFDLWRYAESGGEQRGARTRAWLWMGLGLLVKGPVAWLLPCAALALWAAGSRQWVLLRGALLHPPSWALMLLVAAPWYAYALNRHGMALVDGFLLHHNLERFTGTLEGHRGFAGYHVVMLPVLMLPWTPLLLGVLSNLRRLWARPLERWLLCWAGFVLVFFSLAATKLPHYGLYGLTPLVLLAARGLPQAGRGLRVALWASMAVAVSLLAFGPAAMQAASGQVADAGYRALLQAAPDGRQLWLPGGLALLGLALLAGFRAPWLWRALGGGAVVAGVAVGSAAPWWGEALQGPVKRLAAVARQQGDAGSLVQWRLHQPSFAVYLGRPVARRAPLAGDLALTPVSRLQPDDRARATVLAQEAGLALVRWNGASGVVLNPKGQP